ncbi:PilT/PilU family type 4a pilus ATPase [Hydrogenivirga sp. 128-5-R1-1]|uniref:type IV pilus twitching motility protein PilT n=1 Tax=Hydrogenivirga sp. 128-5-R1-1 TaxID=392423 RepID=UPI00015F382B|nr:PilT/PilU family type 4a pilus ATPase [Hydrogenivirga sp. 128-5-R1-1]EDP76372.1 twitching mobility protein [Hydrogenivirga sp. 128-5-R1-1]
MLQLILKKALDLDASDIHIKVGAKPVYRIHKKLHVDEEFPVITDEHFSLFLNEVIGKSEKKKKEFEELGEIDLSYSLPKVSRFRVNVYKQRGTSGMAFRVIPFQIPPFKTLNLPEVMLKTSLSHSKGLILVTGPTGSGKSTTLASIIEEINKNFRRVIVTIEDPIEYLLRDKNCFIVQREVGIDTQSFARGLRAALREDPDVIMVGEIRDTETAEIALQAAETGHLVFSTLHTLDAKETVNRLIGMFKLEVRDQVRQMLAGVLVAVFSQRLLPRADKKGSIPAVEVMLNTGAIKEALLDPTRIDEIPDLVAKGKAAYGTQTFDQHLEELYRNGQIDFHTAILYATKPSDLELKLRGISSGAEF